MTFTLAKFAATDPDEKYVNNGIQVFSIATVPVAIVTFRFSTGKTFAVGC